MKGRGEEEEPQSWKKGTGGREERKSRDRGKKELQKLLSSALPDLISHVRAFKAWADRRVCLAVLVSAGVTEPQLCRTSITPP